MELELNNYPALVTRIKDGDTYDVTVDVGFHWAATMPLRLAHVDTAELRTAEGVTARDLVAALFGPLPARVIVHTYKPDKPFEKYGRYLADVYVGGTSVADFLVRHGLATPYEGGTKGAPV